MHDERASEALYGKMSEAQMHAWVRQAAGLDGPMLDSQRPSLHAQQATQRREKPLNLVIIVEESLGAQYVGSLGGRGLTPQLDAPVSYTHLDVYKRQAVGNLRVEAPRATAGCALRRATRLGGSGVCVLQHPLRQARYVHPARTADACLLYTSRCV